MEPSLEQIRAQIEEELRGAIDPSQPVAILDVPTYSNVGDHLILEGTLQVLDRLGVRIAYQADIAGFTPKLLRSRMPRGTILIQGGGNFGDIWGNHQRFRERIATEFRDYCIVQLPQSIYYRDESNAEEARKAFGDHPDCHIMIRETASFERAQRLFPGLSMSLVPDMALGCEFERPTRLSLGRTLVLARTDGEATSNLTAIVKPHLSENDTVSDWMLSPRRERQFRLGMRFRNLYIRSARPSWRQWLYPVAFTGYWMMRKACVQGGIEQIASYGVTITDRLHAMVLATLLGIPNVAMDNEYGKVSAVYQEHFNAFNHAQFTQRESELIATWHSLR